MNRSIVAIIIIYFSLIFWGCKPLNLPYQSKANIDKEFQESFYYDAGSLTGFKKGWDWRFFSKKDARKTEKINDKLSLDSIQKVGSPIYAAKRNSYDNTPEYLFVFDVNNYDGAMNYLSGNFRQVESLHGGMAFNFKNLKDKSVTMYFSHDTTRKFVNAFSLIKENSTQHFFLAYYRAKYKNIHNYLKQIYIWNSGKIYDNYVVKHLENSSASVPDSIVMLWPFASFNNLVQTINKYDNFYSLNIFKKPDSLLLLNGQLSYQAALESLTASFQNDFFEEEKYVDLQVYAQTKAFYHSFLGQYKEAMNCEAMYKPVDLTFKLKPSESVLDASAFIMKKIQGRRIVAFNEAHHDVRCRAFVLSFLDSLKKSGFTHLAIEDLNSEPVNGDVYFTSGYYCRESLLHNLIVEACKKGFKVIAYDISSSRKKGKYIERDKIAAKTLLKKVNFKKGEKLAIFCGYGHIDKSTDKNKPASLIDFVQTFSGIEPLTVDLAYPRLYKIADTTINHFYVLKNIQGIGYFHNKKGSNGDIAVYPPTGLSYFDYEYYISNNLLDFKKSVINFVANRNLKDDSLTVYVYRQSNYIQKDKIALPVFTRVIKNCNQTIDLYLPSYEKNYDVEIRSADNHVAMDTSIMVSNF